jgi:hypothetical protein
LPIAYANRTRTSLAETAGTIVVAPPREKSPRLASEDPIPTTTQVRPKENRYMELEVLQQAGDPATAEST